MCIRDRIAGRMADAVIEANQGESYDEGPAEGEVVEEAAAEEEAAVEAE